MANRSVLFWSGGKDCMMALDRMNASEQTEIAYLLTTYDERTNRIPFHGIHIDLIKAQANSLQIPFVPLPLPPSPSNRVYQQIVQSHIDPLKEEGVTSVVFGDIFLKDLRAFRETLFQDMEMDTLFPLWEASTRELSALFLSKGYKAVICGIDTERIKEEVLGQDFNENFLLNIPKGVDPCGENGEFHTFTYDGPLFNQPVHYKTRAKAGTLFGKYKYIELNMDN